MRIENYLHQHYSHYLSKAKEELLENLHKLDHKLFKKKRKHLKVKDIRSRTIWTPQTDLLTFSRRRYYDTKQNKYRYLLDEHLKIDKYKFVSKHYQKLAIFHFDKFMAYKDIASIVFNSRVSKMSIHNFIKNYEPKYTMDHFICQNDGILWINCDGLWIKKNKTSDAIEVKNFLFFSGRKFDGQKWKLQGKAVKHFLETNTETIANELEKIIFNYEGVREVRLVGDGARWIKQIAKKINAIFYIDKFHFSQSINLLLGTKSKKKHLIYKLIDQEFPKPKFRYELLKIVANEETGVITDKQLKIIGYLTNNYWFYIRNYKYDRPICCIEAIQAHYQAKFFKNRRKGWSVKILDKIISFIYSKVNGGWPLEVDVGQNINFPLHSDYSLGTNGTIPGIENPKFKSLIFQK